MTGDGPGLWTALFLGLCACVLLGRSCIARADDSDDVKRCLVAEAPPGPDYPAILSVLSRRSRSLGWAARHYCALFVARHPSARQRAIRQLPGGPSSRIYSRHWRAAGEALEAFRHGDRTDCRADHFGDRLTDAARARRMHWLPVDCGQTANLFWLSPIDARTAAQ